MADIEWSRIAKTALDSVDSLLPKWLPDGRKAAGKEYLALNPMRADDHKGSFSVCTLTGKWGDFATDDVYGGDLISLYAYLFTAGDLVQAAKDLSRDLNIPDAVPPLEKGKGRAAKPASAPKPPPVAKPAPAPGQEDKGEWIVIFPVPEGAPAVRAAHEFRGVPDRRWTYLGRSGELLGYVDRYTTSDGGKDIVPWTFTRHSTKGAQKWCNKQWPEPRPLYGLQKLDAYPDATVLLVEGEKCVDAGAAELPPDRYITLTWPGGGNALGKADFSHLAGRRVATWADCDAKRKKLTKAEVDAGADPLAQPLLPEADQPGVKAMRKAREALHALGCELLDVEIPAPGEKPDGWDIADAVEDGLRGEALLAWIDERAKPWAPADPEADAAASPPPGPPSPPSGDAPPPSDDGAGVPWYKLLHRTDKGRISACAANVYDVLANDWRWQGVIAYDEHAQRVVKLKPPPYATGKVGEWDDQDDTQTAMWMTRRYDFAPASPLVLEAVESLSRVHSFNPVQDWLNGLAPWDGERRIGGWLLRYLGVIPRADDQGKQAEYLKRCGAWFIMGIVARAMQPGCQFDYCLVLEGEQGKRKSTALRALVPQQWFGDTDLDLQNKDAMVALQGKLLYEISEMGAIARSEEKRQKSFLTRRFDEFRPHYGRRNISLPRRVVFAGTTNDWEWNKDPTGGRRFWPVMVGSIDVEALVADRDLLFAEALHYWREGYRFHPTPDEQKTLFDPEQLAREMPDSLVDGLHDWVYKQVAPFSAYTAMTEGLKMDASKMTRDVQTRIGWALRKLGCRKFEKRNGMTRFWYDPPKQEGEHDQAKATTESTPSASSGTPDQASQEGGRRAGF
jgi:predicted P-loop ATPase